MLKWIYILWSNVLNQTGQFSSIAEKGALFLQKCIKCNSQFGWRKIFQSYKWTYGPLECDNCGTIHKITVFGRFTVTFLTMLPFLIAQFFLIPSDNIFLTICGAALIAIIGFLLSPYVVRYKERLWGNIHLQ